MEQAQGLFEQVLSLADAVVPGGRSSLAPSNVIGGLVMVLSACRSFSSSVDEALALVPHHTVFTSVAFCPVPFMWNVATAHFFEANLLKAVLVTPCLVVLTRLLERLWTAQAIAVHLVFTATFSGLGFFVAELIHVYRTHHDKEWFVPTRGCAGLLVALAVGVRHAYPLEAIPMVPRAWGLQCQHLPFGITCFFCLVGFTAPGLLEDWFFAPLALFFGWLHLRYLMWFPHAQAHGDHSAEFLFASLFPRPLRPLVGCLGAIVHSLTALVAPSFLQLRQVDGDTGHAIVYDPSRASEEGVAWVGSSGSLSLASMPMAVSGVSSGPVVPGGPGSKEYAARRAKALALLDQNINSFLAPENSGRPESIGRDLDFAAPPPLATPPALSAVPAPLLPRAGAGESPPCGLAAAAEPSAATSEVDVNKNL